VYRSTGAIPYGSSRNRIAREPRPSLASGCLYRLVGRKESRDLAAGQLCSQLFTRLTEDLAVNHGDCRKDCLPYVAKVRVCSMSASEALYRSTTMHSDWSSLR
jgi:hypothetical protein